MCKSCLSSGLVPGDVIEVDQIVDPVMHNHHQLVPRSRGIVVNHNEYYTYIPEMQIEGDDEHIAVVWYLGGKLEAVSGAIPLVDGKLRWHKVAHGSPRYRDQVVNETVKQARELQIKLAQETLNKPVTNEEKH